jgi:hypothetical protein
MVILGILWAPALVAVIGTLLVTGLGAIALNRQFAGQPDDSMLSWLLVPFMPEALFLFFIALAAFWAGARSRRHNLSRLRGALVAGSIPLIVVVAFLLLSLLTTGQSEVDELLEQKAIVNVSFAIATAMVLGWMGAILDGGNAA